MQDYTIQATPYQKSANSIHEVLMLDNVGKLHFLPHLDHKTVQIGSDWKDDETIYVHFLVSDSGKGISSEDQATIFTRFSQGTVNNYSQYGGSGLGLYICRSLVEIHGGQIGFYSTVGIGSSFGFCIKTRRIEQIPSKTTLSEVGTPENLLKMEGLVTTASRTKPEIQQHLHIMIVEDNIINQKVLSKQLQKAGHSITIANNGQECLDFLAGTHFGKIGGSMLSVILMDIEMPVMNGIDCTMEIRRMEKEGKIRSHVPIIATTGNARNEKVGLIKDAGVDGVILKPYSVSDLLRLVEALTQK
jgi:CheY-like chemotaxis protein